MLREDIVKCEEVLLYSDKMCVLDARLSRWCLCTPSHNCWLPLFCLCSCDCVCVCVRVCVCGRRVKWNERVLSLSRGGKAQVSLLLFPFHHPPCCASISHSPLSLFSSSPLSCDILHFFPRIQSSPSVSDVYTHTHAHTCCRGITTDPSWVFSLSVFEHQCRSFWSFSLNHCISVYACADKGQVKLHYSAVISLYYT